MPKIKKEDIEEEELEDDEELDDDFDEEDELENPPERKIKRKSKPKEEVKRRFGLIGPQPLRIVDTETNELVGEGEFAVIQALTDILERLERIEIQIGAVTGQ